MLSGPTASAKAAARAAADLAQEKLEEQHSEFDWNPVVAQQMLVQNISQSGISQPQS